MSENSIIIEDIPTSTRGISAKQISFSAQLNDENIDEKSKIIYQLIEENPKDLKLLLNFENLDYMSSKSINFLTDWYSKITDGNGKIVIAQAQPNIMDILELVGITKIIKCFSTVDEARMELLSE